MGQGDGVRGLLALAVLVVAGGCSGGSKVQVSTTTSISVAPSTVEVPRSTEASTTSSAAPLLGTDAAVSELVRVYLASDGATIVDFRRAIGPLRTAASGRTAQDMLSVCASVADSLASVDPGKVLVAATGLPDAMLSELAVDERRLVSDSLVACGAGDSQAMNSALTALQATDVMMERRMRDLGLA